MRKLWTFPKPFLWLPKPWLQMSPGYPCCEDEGPTPGDDCGYCSGVTPLYLTAVVTGITEGTCGNCNDLNSEAGFICEQATGPFSECAWQYIFDPEVCTIARLLLQLLKIGGDYKLQAYYQIALGGDQLGFEKDFGATNPDCATWNELELNLVYDNPGFTCDGSAAICKVTSGA